MVREGGARVEHEHREGLAEDKDMACLIKDAFLTLYRRRGAEGMTIASLCRTIPCARSTFYAHFDNLRDVLDAIEDEVMSALSLPAATGIVSEDGAIRWDMLEEKGNIVQAHRDTLSLLFVERPDVELVRRWTHEIREANRRHFMRHVGSQDLELVLDVFAAGALCFWREWICDPRSIDAARIERVLRSLGMAVPTQ